MSRKNSKYLSTSSEWSFELLDAYYFEIEKSAQKYGLNTYPNQIEIISSEQMMNAYAMVGMPIGYAHWSYGKKFLSVEKQYKRGMMGLAYEIVINSNPCISYLMEENTMMMQALVMAHACFGHNSFFKNNYLFRSWTNADAIIDYLLFAKNYVMKCEELYGEAVVEQTLDACHALMNYGVDRYKRPPRLSLREEERRQQERQAYLQLQVNDLWRTIPKSNKHPDASFGERFPAEPQENILYFLEKNAPLLEPWQREIARIVRKIAQYFYPQKQTKVMNEGWATFWHYTLINDLYDQGLVNDAFMMEFLQSHTSVVAQPSFDSPYYSGINPYALGYAMYQDLRRICEQPTEEDRAWFPDLVDTDWKKTLDFAMINFKDESFIAQYLSPKLIREFKFFSVLDNDQNEHYTVPAIHDELGYRTVREWLSDQYNLSSFEPNIQVYQVNHKTDRSLILRHVQHNRVPLDPKSAREVLRYLQFLWGFDVYLEEVDVQGNLLHSQKYPHNPTE